MQDWLFRLGLHYRRGKIHQHHGRALLSSFKFLKNVNIKFKALLSLNLILIYICHRIFFSRLSCLKKKQN